MTRARGRHIKNVCAIRSPFGHLKDFYDIQKIRQMTWIELCLLQFHEVWDTSADMISWYYISTHVWSTSEVRFMILDYIFIFVLKVYGWGYFYIFWHVLFNKRLSKRELLSWITFRNLTMWLRNLISCFRTSKSKYVHCT